MHSYQTDANWDLTHPKLKHFISKMAYLEADDLWGIEIKKCLAAFRAAHMRRVRSGDGEFALELLMTDGTWIYTKTFAPISCCLTASISSNQSGEGNKPIVHRKRPLRRNAQNKK